MRERSVLQVEMKRRMRDERHKLNSSYPEDRLIYLKSQLNDAWRNDDWSLDDIMSYMANYLPRNHWKEFFEHLGGEKLASVLSQPQSSNLLDDVKHRALAYLVICQYAAQRQQSGRHNSSFAVIGSIAVTIPEKEVKVKVANTLLEKLLKGESLAEITAFLKREDGLTPAEKKAATEGKLGQILKRFFMENPSLAPKVVDAPIANTAPENTGYFGGIFSWFSASTPKPVDLTPAPNLKYGING